MLARQEPSEALEAQCHSMSSWPPRSDHTANTAESAEAARPPDREATTVERSAEGVAESDTGGSETSCTVEDSMERMPSLSVT